jgi:hypothetical protein
MTWDDLAAYIRSRFTTLLERPDSLSIRWNGDGTRDVGPQKLVVIHATLTDLPCVMVVALVGAEHGLSCRDALINSSAYIAGGLALKDGAYTLRITAFLDTLRRPELGAMIEYAASKATDLRGRLKAPVVDDALFAWFRD